MKQTRYGILDAVMLGGLLVTGSYVARKSTELAWQLASDDPPPDPDDPDEDLREVLILSLVSGILVGLTRLLLRRGFAQARDQPLRERIRRRLS